MNYELFIARRLRLSGEGKRGMSPSIVIAVAGIALSVVVMMLAVSIVCGFKSAIKDKVTGFDSQVTVYPATFGNDVQPEYLADSPGLDSVIVSTGLFSSMVPVMMQSAIIKTDSTFQAIVIKGLPADKGWDFVADNIVDGKIPDYAVAENKNKIILSRVISNKLGLNVGDKVNAYFFSENSLKARRVEVSAIYDTNFGDYDRMIVFGLLPMLQGVAGVEDNMVSHIELMTNGVKPVDESALALQNEMMLACYTNKLKGTYRLGTVTDSGMMYFNWLELLDTNVIVILVLMGLVSGFTLISSLFIIILERVNMVGILKSLGASNMEIRQIFTYVAQKLVLYGMLIGNVLGLAFIFIQKYTGILPLDPEAYYLDYVPVEISWLNILILNIGVFLLCWAMILIPVQIVARINPAATIRYE